MMNQMKILKSKIFIIIWLETNKISKENIMRMYEKCRKSITFSQEVDTSDWFQEEICQKDKEKFRRADSSRYE